MQFVMRANKAERLCRQPARDRLLLLHQDVERPNNTCRPQYRLFNSTQGLELEDHPQAAIASGRRKPEKRVTY